MRLYPPEGPLRGFVFLFSDASGPTQELARDAQALAGAGAATMVVDLAAYLRHLRASDDGCHYLISELEELSKVQQRALGASAYHSPILAGVGQGGTLAYAALAQSPAATIGGAVSADPAPALATRVPLCEGAHALRFPAGGFEYKPPTQPLPGVWRTTTAADLVSVVSRLLSDIGAEAAEAALAGLPIVRLPAASPGPLFAVIYSGDGGWRDLDKTIGEFLAQRGVSVIGVDSLRYFWRERTPEEVARDLATILEAETARGSPSRRAILIGYSFGADILPFVWNRLPERWRARVVQVSLLGLGSHAAFEFHLSGWIESPDTSGPATLPELLRMDLSLVQCFYGQSEEDTVCPNPKLAGAEVIATTGSHHFDGDYAKLAQRILDGALRRAAAQRVTQRATTPVTPPEISAAASASTSALANPPGAAR
ncbi:MAG TPA: AcvB/VirJ family lysyl-phosphatidylglycerol hydrolase [Myxococcota bacterium]|nr:AcvB/VirJ family lysyl-phosphatidylglycerol hydrolase [Myxococcota bacterium]